ncbi:hypothetical protein GCM10007108_08720 [Thermogymnomonas acidicola]|uniref:Type II secretion system protein GspF domain-containing protein n=1 Tax=Thermogymnomonas acidicola TaxID=399579 RepID=A0AA37BR69_9ARCH|nr:type II secretion system F family protein [Thermogymnomonas acidicola]GGM72887.1 hypothetical protein GCM10007108_08720 [Thermogymnomonas acidicola]
MSTGMPVPYVSSIIISTALVAYGYTMMVRNRRRREAERMLPDFLRDLSDYLSFGLPMADALRNLSESNYGPLSGNLATVNRLVAGGTPVSRAILSLSRGLGSVQVERVSSLISVAADAGGSSPQVIRSVADFAQRLQAVANNRSAEMKNYLLIMAVATAVFIFVIVIMEVRFLDAISAFSLSSGTLLHGFGYHAISSAFNLGLLVSSAFSGFISGLIVEDRPGAALFYSGLFLLASSLVLLAVVLA